MRKIKSNYSFLFFGLLIGLLIGSSIMWWKEKQSGEWIFFKKINSFFSVLDFSDDKNAITLSKINQVNLHARSKRPSRYTSSYSKNINNSSDSTTINEFDQAALDEFIAQYGQGADSLVIDSFIRSQHKQTISSEDIFVAKDQLLCVKLIEAKGVEGIQSSKSKNLDSLLTDERSNAKSSTLLFDVEFWKSPINYKGYKRTKNHVVIFGVYQTEITSLKYLNKNLFLVYDNKYYQIDNSTEFKPLIPVNNPQTLSQLKKS